MSTLAGWDDGSIFFIDDEDNYLDISGYPELEKKLLEVCETFFNEQKREEEALRLEEQKKIRERLEHRFNPQRYKK